MANSVKLNNLKSYLNNLDLFSAYITLIVGITIIFLSYFSPLKQQFIGFTLMSISLIYIKYVDKFNQFSHVPINIDSNKKFMLDIVYFVFYSISLIICFSEPYKRPTLYFVLIGILSGLIAINILYSNEKRSIYLIIFKIFLLSFNIRTGIFYLFPSIIGYDAYSHVSMVQLITENGFLPSQEKFGKYFYYPVYHLFISSAQILLNVDSKNAVFLSIGLVSIFITLFVYLIGKNVGGIQVGLLAILLVNITNYSILRGIANITPGSLVFCYFLIALYLILNMNRNILQAGGLTAIAYLMLITHQLTIFVVFLGLCMMYFSSNLFSHISSEKNDIYISKSYLFLFAISIQSYWMYTYVYSDVSFFEYVLRPLLSVLRSGAEYGSDVLVVGFEYERTFLQTFLLQLCYLIFPFFGIGGALTALSKHTTNKKFSIAVTFGLLFASSYIIPLFGMRNLLTARWMPIIAIFSSILTSFFILKIIDIIKSKNSKILVTYSVIFIISLFMVLTPAINKDNPLLDDYTTRNQYTYSEISASKTISSIVGNEILTDGSFSHCIEFYGSNSKEKLNFFSLDQINTRSGSLEMDNNSFIIFRKVSLEEPVSFKYGDLYGVYVSTIIPIKFFNNFDDISYNLVYNNKNILGYTVRKI